MIILNHHSYLRLIKFILKVDHFFSFDSNDNVHDNDGDDAYWRKAPYDQTSYDLSYSSVMKADDGCDEEDCDGDGDGEDEEEEEEEEEDQTLLYLRLRVQQLENGPHSALQKVWYLGTNM